jgi:hypothetical protein
MPENDVKFLFFCWRHNAMLAPLTRIGKPETLIIHIYSMSFFTISIPLLALFGHLEGDSDATKRVDNPLVVVALRKLQ